MKPAYERVVPGDALAIVIGRVFGGRRRIRETPWQQVMGTCRQWWSRSLATTVTSSTCSPATRSALADWARDPANKVIGLADAGAYAQLSAINAALAAWGKDPVDKQIDADTAPAVAAAEAAVATIDSMQATIKVGADDAAALAGAALAGAAGGGGGNDLLAAFGLGSGAHRPFWYTRHRCRGRFAG